MRFVCLLFATLSLSSTGCTAVLAGCGKDLGALATQSQVHEEFGSPTATGISEGQPYEEFKSHCKVAGGWKGGSLVMGYYATFGLGELIWFPTELYWSGRRSILGQAIRFTYDASGSVTEVRLDGETVPWTGRIRESQPPETAPAINDIGGQP